MTRVLSGAALIALAVAVVYAPVVIFEGVAFILLFLAVQELVALFEAGGVHLPRWAATAAALLTLAAFTEVIGRHAVPLEVALLVALVALSLVVMRIWQRVPALTTISSTLFPSLYPALSIGSVVAVREARGAAALALLMLTIIVSDTAQYYTGRAVGRRKLAAAISPNKTIEGAVGGFVFGAAVFAWVGAWWLPGVPAGARLLLGASVVAAGIAGDLFESMLKRSVGIKDSSTLIPGHGGILDRIDALLFAAPVYYVVLRYTSFVLFVSLVVPVVVQ